MQEQMAQIFKDQEEAAAKVADAEAEFRAVKELVAVGSTTTMASNLMDIVAGNLASIIPDPAVFAGIMQQIFLQAGMVASPPQPPGLAAAAAAPSPATAAVQAAAAMAETAVQQAAAAAVAAAHQQAAAEDAAAKAAATAAAAEAALQNQVALQAASVQHQAELDAAAASAPSVVAAARVWPPGRAAPGTPVGTRMTG